MGFRQVFGRVKGFGGVSVGVRLYWGRVSFNLM